MALKFRVFPVLLLLAGLLSSCSQPLADSGIYAVYQTAVATFAPQGSPTVVQTPDAQETFISVEVVDPTATAAGTSGPIPVENCNRAVPAIPFDVTIPDGTQMRPAEAFSKTWRLLNAGDCAWAQDFAAVWFSGERLSSSSTQFLRAEVQPGEWIDVTVDMIAPSAPGFYQSNWKLSDSNGNLFGLGPSGDAPFWVRIEVISPNGTATPIPSAVPKTVTIAASMVLPEAYLTLHAQDRLDLDSGKLNAGDDADVVLRKNGNSQLVLVPERASRIAVFGGNEPSEQQCRDANLPSDEILLNEDWEGEYLCFESDQGLYGYVQLIDISRDTLAIDFLAWLVP